MQSKAQSMTAILLAFWWAGCVSVKPVTGPLEVYVGKTVTVVKHNGNTETGKLLQVDSVGNATLSPQSTLKDSYRDRYDPVVIPADSIRSVQIRHTARGTKFLLIGGLILVVVAIGIAANGGFMGDPPPGGWD